jgi:hypothetical protein
MVYNYFCKGIYFIEFISGVSLVDLCRGAGNPAGKKSDAAVER